MGSGVVCSAGCTADWPCMFCRGIATCRAQPRGLSRCSDIPSTIALASERHERAVGRDAVLLMARQRRYWAQ
jgi:hypothetical protein